MERRQGGREGASDPVRLRRVEKTGPPVDGEGAARPHPATNRAGSRSILEVERTDWHRLAKSKSFLRHRLTPDAAGLVDHARLHAAEKRGNHPIHFSIDDLQIPIDERAGSILALDEVLARLEKFDETQARIVEMRFFGGLNNQEIVESVDISERSVGREWQAARLWLYRELNLE